MERRVVAIQGTVQGVGFRPFVFGLARDLKLGGFVLNHRGGVRIEVEGEARSLDAFLARLIEKPPPLARIDRWSFEVQPARGERQFRIDASDQAAAGAVVITPDAGTCAACLAEMLNPRDRRYRYPFLNCTDCGPRLTIVTAAPYDRGQTTMAGFVMCPACRAEYEDPSNRRFHAQPTACADCGPRLAAMDATGRPIDTDDPLGTFVEAIGAGKIGALKGLGGYHLVCDARRAESLRELRRRKARDEKPFAVMTLDAESAERICEMGAKERELLCSPRRPIVLLRKRAGADLDENIAPRNPFLGIMLPYTPLHYLLMHDMGGAPLVMTSGNRSDEPIAIDQADAVQRLRGIADIFLTHDRAIHVRCDDSVTRVMDGVESPIRRSRGDAPRPILLPMNCSVPILAVGGQLKSTFALGRDRQAVISHHMGDLDHFAAHGAFQKDIALYEQLFSIRPACVAHDLHPDYAATRYAIERAGREQIRTLPIQHHHAHMASCMAEHGLSGPVIGVTWDGTGFGPDGAIWGGEFLVGDYRQFRRAAHLRYVGMPGGEQAVREPWRMAMGHLLDAQVSCAMFERRIPAASRRTMQQMIHRRFNTPITSSAGRLFDAVAALIGLRDRVSYEGQAAIELEQLAYGVAPDGLYPFDLPPTVAPGGADEVLAIDTRPMIRAIAAEVDAGTPAGTIARRFHCTLVQIIDELCVRLRAQTGLQAVVLSGGVFVNALLTQNVMARLEEKKFCAYRHCLVPTNDGGLSFGQLAIAAASL